MAQQLDAIVFDTAVSIAKAALQQMKPIEDYKSVTQWVAYSTWQSRGCPAGGGHGPEYDWQMADRAVRMVLETIACQSIEENKASDLGQLLATPECNQLVLPESSSALFLTFNSLISDVASGSRALKDLGWKEFEDLMGEILTEAGWSITPMGYTKDGGIDLIAVKHVDPGIPIEMMVQCKRNRPARAVGIEVVREVWSVKWEHGFHQAMIATTSRFTRGARNQATKWNFDLRDQAAIVDWCKALRPAS